MRHKIKNVHFTGIGGCGMCGIAEILHNLGYSVTGSDLQDSSNVRYLKNLGIKIKKGHKSEYVTDTNLVVISSAVPEDNVEIIAARAAKIPVIRRAEMLGELMRMKYAVGIAGTHGKTTTTSMAGSIFTEADMKPTIIVGGIVKNLNTGAVSGTGDYLIAEADEYDRSFLSMYPTVAVITTLDIDHLDCYESIEEIKNAFIEYANKVPFFGTVIVCLDDPEVQKIIPEIKKDVTTYGFSAQADVRAENLRHGNMAVAFDLVSGGKKLGRINLNVPGEHNVLNALASAASALDSGISFSGIKKGLERFNGVRRRFEIKGKRNGVTVIDDYAHHPTEIKASLGAARESHKGRIIAVFQPHLYSRTRDFQDSFGSSFFNSDLLVVAGIYAAREKPVKGVSGKLISDAAVSHGHRNVKYIKDLNKIPEYIEKTAKPGDLVITIGAGDVYKAGEKFLKGVR
ncbi:MAG: UDP-N-acetylmuramate--L-alanine ligase [Fibrobacterota bacterium]